MWEHQGHDLAERQRERPVLRNDLIPTVQGSGRCLAQRHLVRSQRPVGAHESRFEDEGMDQLPHILRYSTTDSD